jgi:hypothetical protein
MNGFKDFLMHTFQMVDLKEIIFFLGIRIRKTESESSGTNDIVKGYLKEIQYECV